ncbi:MAG TPA: hypothetical protein VHD62_12610 [Opitutaceae bacterium]|nr:hypothetical protein [Opitutaceae bacterium]
MNSNSRPDSAADSNRQKEAKRWSAQNEQQKPAMNEQEQRGVQQAQKKNPGAVAPESTASNETFPERTRRPGTAGLANDARPGLGTRRESSDEPVDTEPIKYRQPRPAPREQNSQSLAQEEQRDTGVSGHSGAD